MKLIEALHQEAVFDESEFEKAWEDFKSLPEAGKEGVFLKVLLAAKHTQSITIDELKSFIKQPPVGAWGTRKGEQSFGGTGHFQRKPHGY